MHGRGVTARDVHLSRARRVQRSQPPARTVHLLLVSTDRGDQAPDTRMGRVPSVTMTTDCNEGAMRRTGNKVLSLS